MILRSVASSMTDENDKDVQDDLRENNSALLAEKVDALEHLIVYANTMKAAFGPWLQPSMELTLKALVCPDSEHVREVSHLPQPQTSDADIMGGLEAAT
jgi:hypothetical protein